MSEGGESSRPGQPPSPEWKVIAGSSEGLHVPESEQDLIEAFLAAKNDRKGDRMSGIGLRNGEEKAMRVDDVSPFFDVTFASPSFQERMKFVQRTKKYPPYASVFNSAAVVGLPPSKGDFYLYTQDAAEVDDPDYLNAKSKLRKLGRNGVYHIGRADLPTPDLETNREVSREHGEITIDFNGASVRYKDISKNGSVVEVHEPATNQTLADALEGRKPQEPRFRAKDRQQVYQEEVDKRGGLN